MLNIFVEIPQMVKRNDFLESDDDDDDFGQERRRYVLVTKSGVVVAVDVVAACQTKTKAMATLDK